MSGQGRAAASFSRQVARFLCSDRDGETQFRAKGRETASAPAPDIPGPPTLRSTPRERQISELQKMPPLPNRTQRRRRARISSEYYSSSDAYTPLYPSPIESVHAPVYPAEGSRRSRSEGLRPGAGDPSWFVGEDRSEAGRDTAGSQGIEYVVQASRTRRRRNRYSRSRFREISPPDTYTADTGEPRRSGCQPPPERTSSCSQETLIVERVDLAGTGSRKERRVLRRNSTGTVQIMEVGSSRSGQSASVRSGS